jgi:hypothetical protein
MLLAASKSTHRFGGIVDRFLIEEIAIPEPDVLDDRVVVRVDDQRVVKKSLRRIRVHELPFANRVGSA